MIYTPPCFPTGLPPPPEKDPYLKSRLDRFYSELKDYRPGMNRADLEEQQRLSEWDVYGKVYCNDPSCGCVWV